MELGQRSQQQQVGGMVNRAFLAGSHENSRFLKKFPRAVWPGEGNYRLQTTPNEVCAVVTHTRTYLKGKRMLCLGVGTLGAERFIAENSGILEMDVLVDSIVNGERLPGFKFNRDSIQGIKVNEVVEPNGQYDLITLAGNAEWDTTWVTRFTKKGTIIACIGTGVHANQPKLRTAWFTFRKHHMVYQTLLQTGGLNYETGVGVVKVLTMTKEALENEAAMNGGVQDGEEKQESEGAENPGDQDTGVEGETSSPAVPQGEVDFKGVDEPQTSEIDEDDDLLPEGRGEEIIKEVSGILPVMQGQPVKRKGGRPKGSKNTKKAD